MPFSSFESLTNATLDAWMAASDGIIIVHKKRCPHCKIMGTVLVKVKAQAPALKVACVDSEDEAEAMARLGVERVPTLCFVKGGQVRDRKTGIFNPREVLAACQSA